MYNAHNVLYETPDLIIVEQQIDAENKVQLLLTTFPSAALWSYSSYMYFVYMYASGNNEVNINIMCYMYMYLCFTGCDTCSSDL